MEVTKLTFRPASGGFKCNQNGIFVKRKPRKTYALKYAKEEINRKKQEVEKKNSEMYPKRSQISFREKSGWPGGFMW